MALRGGRAQREGSVTLPGFWRFAWHQPCFQSLHLVLICDWCPSSCYPGVEPRGCGSAYVLSLCEPFKQFLENTEVSPPPQPPLIFTDRRYGNLPSWCWNPGLCALAWGWDCSLPRYPSWFLSTTCESGTVILHLPLCRLSACCCVSAPPTHLDEYGFLKYLVVGLPYR